MMGTMPAALQMVVLAQQYGAFTGLIGLLQGLVIGVFGIGALIGIAFIAAAGPNKDFHERGLKILGGSLTGIFLGLLAVPVYNLFSTLIEGF